jgi:hypothetical protein
VARPDQKSLAGKDIHAVLFEVISVLAENCRLILLGESITAEDVTPLKEAISLNGAYDIRPATG